MKQEFKLLKSIIRDYTPEEYPYVPEEGTPAAKKSDYDAVDVIPVSDPNAATMSQKVVQYQAALQLAQTAPQLYNLPQLHRQMLDVLGIKNAQKLVPIEDDQKPKDPISENMDMLRMKPLKAFAYQDHQAHIATHLAFLRDPMTAQMIGQNPMAPQMAAGMQAHIAEHYGYMYRNMIEQQVGAPLPTVKEDEQMSEEMETALSRLVAQAAQNLTLKNQQQAAQQQAQQQAQDPIIQMQMQELQIKAAEQQRKAAKDQVDAQLKAAQIQVEQERIASQERQAMENLALKSEIEGTKLGVDIERGQIDQQFRQELEGTRLGVQIAQSMQNQKAPPKQGE
jgi:hypothetical protein